MKLNKLSPRIQDKILEMINRELWIISSDLKNWEASESNGEAYREMVGWKDALKEMVDELKDK